MVLKVGPVGSYWLVHGSVSHWGSLLSCVAPAAQTVHHERIFTFACNVIWQSKDGGYWLCVHTCLISTQSVWQDSVAITTPPWVAFLSHQPCKQPIVCGSLPQSHSIEWQQTTTMHTRGEKSVFRHGYSTAKPPNDTWTTFQCDGQI